MNSLTKIPPLFILASLGVLFTSFSFSQNLVPNFSFEQYDTCPNMEDQIQYSLGWSKYSSNSMPTNTTPDYYNSCSPDTLFGIPKNLGCYQMERRNCNAYAGIATWGQPSYRECIGIQLSSPLAIGQKYFISFYTVMGEDFISGTHFGMPSNNIGLRLSTVPYTPANPVPIDNFAHLNSSTVIADSTNWQRISGSLIADSAYQYVVLGNFFDDANTDTVHYSCGSCLNAESYYLIDDICVSTDSLLANGGIDTLPCTTGINELSFKDELSIFPNPASAFFTLHLPSNEIREFFLYDVCGKIILTDRINNNKAHIDLSKYSSGLYLIKVITKNNVSITKRVIKP